MKKITVRICLALLLSLMVCTAVHADSQKGKIQPDIITDYYMIVESKAGGIDMYSNPDLGSTKLNEELIPNGTALHIEGEVENNGTWGYAEYHGMMGFAPLKDCRPAQSRQEAIDSELYIAGRNNVDYYADYDVKAYSSQGSQKLYQGPGEKYGPVPNLREIENGETLHITQDAKLVDGSHWGKTSVDGKNGWINLEDTDGPVPNLREIENGETLHITQDAKLVDGSHWGKTSVDGKNGWINLEDTEEARKSKEAVTPTEEAALSKEPKNQESEKAEEPAMLKTETNPAEEKVEVTPVEEAAVPKEETNTAEEKVEVTPTEEAAKPEDKITDAPAENTEAASTEKKETDSASSDRTEAEKEQPEAEKASSTEVESSSGIPRSFIWIALAAVLAASGVLVYHFIKR